MPESTPGQPRADRNLLFGILALQADLISRDALIGAMNAWAVNKATPLGQILRDQGALDEEGHALVEALVRRSLDRHQSDAEQSLAALSALGSARQELEQIADAEVQASLAHVIGALPADGATTVGRPTSSGQRFRILRPHAKGGLGEVFVAHDEELHREVALKEIQEQHADQPDSRARFLLEAEITGGLEHPHIVPVYGLGHYPDGRPYYAMRFIRGDSLKDAIGRFHQADTPERDVGERALALRELLGQFVAVCNAVAYAHSRGVLHRDLKPGNVMLGKYGETLVVDWGLAKVVGQSEGASTEEGTLRPSSTDSAEPTRMGSAIGTPAFMSPEQAAGRLDLLGPASDVYSLGATLYALLTGRAPFEKGDAGAILQRVQRGEFPRPRQVKAGVPAALEAICLKAMALRPEQRYGTPLALVDDVEHWLADEPVSAYREPLPTRLGRWRRRHRGLVAGLTTAVLVALLLGGIGVFWLVEQAAELRRGVEAALDQATERQQQARWDEAEAVLEQAQARLGEGGPQDLQERLAQARANLGLVRRLDAARLKAATWVGDRYDYAATAREYAAAFRDAGLGQEGGDKATMAARIRDSAIRDQLVAALDDWAFVTGERRRQAWLLAVARQADPDRRRNRLRDPALWRQPAELERRVRQVQVSQLSPQLLGAIGLVLLRQGGQAIPLLTAAQRQYPTDFWLTFNLGNALLNAKKPGEAIGYHRAALALRPTAFAVHNNLGLALSAKGDLDRAIACYHKALALEPKLAAAHSNLGIALQAKGDLDGAIACFHKALALDPKHATAHNNLGVALKAKGDLDGAIACFHKALALNPKYALAYNNLGNALKDKGQLDRAIACFHKALAIDPKHVLAHTSLGVALADKGELDKAIACYHKALAINPEFAMAHFSLGNALSAKGERDRAIACWEKALALNPKFAKAHTNLGLALEAKGELDGAIACFQKALALDPKDAKAHTNLGAALAEKGQLARAIACYEKALALDPKLAKAYYNLGNALYAKGELDGAIACYKKALALDPRDAKAHYNLGTALWKKGQLDRAIACYENAVAIDPRLAEAHTNLGNALQAKGQLDRAISCHEKALALDPKGGKTHTNLGNALQAKGDLDGAIACYHKALAIDRKLALAHGALGQALLLQGRFREARDSTHRSYRLLPARHPLRPRVFQQLRQCERLLVLEAQLPTLLQGKNQPASPAERLEYAGLCQLKKLSAAAARFYTEAFAADPQLADNLAAGHRYLAACAAALAAGGQGQDAGQLTAQQRARLRQQALAWLRADLDRWTKILDSGNPQARATVQQKLQHWQHGPALAGIRDAAWIVNLPAEELRACRRLWADVAALLQKAQANVR
jgi:tetratricopeptide (TPR) repeat protein/tRNA A-37 threonylcarbamoyl transferase component Bud32